VLIGLAEVSIDAAPASIGLAIPSMSLVVNPIDGATVSITVVVLSIDKTIL
jgi:hypothetical protein